MNTKRIKYIFTSAILIWTLIITFLVIFEMIKIKTDTNELIKTEAQANFNKDQAIRHWSASHGGVYVPIDSITPASQYLSHIEDRDIETKSGKKLTLMNPAYMIRQLNEYFTEYYGVVGHITSLKLLRPENKPDDWEKKALEQFESGITEVSEYDTINGEPYFRLIQPMMVTQNCLKCHAHQNYKVGDIRGSVAVSIPAKQYYKREFAQKKQILLIFGLLWLIVSIILIISYCNLKKQIEKKEKAEQKIRIQHIEIQQKNEQLKRYSLNLENQVKERTKELSESREELIVQNKLIIIEKEKAEDSEKKLKEAQQIAQLGNWVLDIQNNKLTWSDEIYRIFNLKPKEFKATYEAFLNNIHTDDRKKVNEAYTNSLKTKLPYEIEHRLLLKNGEIKYVKEKCKTEFDKSGKALFSYGIVIDITKEKNTEEQLRQAKEQAEDSNRTKDKFFSIISHDLKSPFNAIFGFSNLLLKNHKKYDDEKREKIIKSVNNAATNTFNLLENLLTWSRSQSGVIEYFPEKLHLKILLFETMFDLQGQADKKNIHILDDISENELFFIDKNMIATVLRNLISNAIKFTNNGGSIIISAKKHTGSNFIEISVEDSGVGIAKETIGELFRIDKNTSTQGTENEAGTGLGLILCKEFVEKHGGEIWVESKENIGSTFSFSIPEVTNN